MSLPAACFVAGAFSAISAGMCESDHRPVWNRHLGPDRLRCWRPHVRQPEQPGSHKSLKIHPSRNCTMISSTQPVTPRHRVWLVPQGLGQTVMLQNLPRDLINNFCVQLFAPLDCSDLSDVHYVPVAFVVLVTLFVNFLNFHQAWSEANHYPLESAV